MTVRVQLGGEPETIRALASWLREDLASRVEESVTIVRRARQETADAWLDGASLMFLLALERGGAAAHSFGTRVEELATLLDECASQLEYAKGQMSAASQVVLANRLRVADGWIHCPQEFDEENVPPAEAPITRSQIFQTRMDAFLEVDHMVERACQTTVELLEKLGHCWKTYWSRHIFTAGDFVSGETHALATWYESRFRADAGHAQTWGSYWGDQEREWRRFPEMRGRFERYRAEERAGARVATRLGGRAGLVARVFSRVSTLLVPVSVAWDISEGTPPLKAVASGGLGVLGGFVGGFAMGLATGGLGWIVLGAAVGGIAASQLSDAAYDSLDPDGSWNPEPAWRKLLRESSDLDPGPCSTRDG